MEINKKKFYRQVFALVIPMALQNLINVGVTAADVLMLGRVSEKSFRCIPCRADTVCHDTGPFWYNIGCNGFDRTVLGERRIHRRLKKSLEWE